ncbi:Uncharacterized protein OBRU01_05590 [Operophtera brumata]|uniref:Carboxylesterase type B domain-containing protein n=1 Tax=Operophtera brumata TaxID=104452 RepID=A0A0L7LI86_OPEBR|nr:Uncharacterized protein OBRU01_05590 [Operophtera brumata]
MAVRLPLHLCNSIKQYCSKIIVFKFSTVRFNLRLVILLVLLLSESTFCIGFSGRNSMLRTRVIGTRYGKLQGVILPMDQHKYLKPVEAYLGVPYATPPTGSNRFAPTRAPAPWDDVKTVDQMGPVCPQKLPDIANETLVLERMPKGRLEYLRRLLPRLKNQSEDCLYMNIYTPVQGKNIIPTY